MSDLEQSIADWRKQMLAAGIKTPVPLEELEIHLREEVEQQLKSGLNEQEAFNSAIQKIGQAHMVQKEFKKLGFWGVPMPADRTVFRAKFETIFVSTLALMLLSHLGLLLKDDGLNFLNVEGLPLAILIAFDLVFAMVIAKIFCRVTALGISTDGVSASSTWLMMRHFVGWPDIKLVLARRFYHLCVFQIHTTSGRKFKTVLSRTNADELMRGIRRIAPQTDLQEADVTNKIRIRFSVSHPNHRHGGH